MWQLSRLLGCLILVSTVLHQNHSAAFDELTSTQLSNAIIEHAIQINEYEISGNSSAELREQLDKLGPKDSLGASRDAYTLWNISWDWPSLTNGKPDFSKTKSSYSVTMIIPRWNGSRGDPELQAQWNNYHSALLAHELQHAAHAILHYKEVAEAVRSAAESNPLLTAKEANKIAEAILTKIRALDRQLDRETRHGHTQGVVLK